MTSQTRAYAAAFAAAALLPVVPAHADHPSPSAGGSLRGGGLQVSGPETLSAGTTAVQLTTVFVKPERRRNSTLAGLAGDHVHAHASDYSLRAAFTAAFGISDRLTVIASLPFIRHDEIREGEHSHGHGGAVNSVVNRGSISGVGDATILAKYGLLRTDQGGLALLAGVKAPTGSTKKRDREGERFETEHQPGSGGWDLLLGTAGGVPVGSFQLDGSAMYQRVGKGAMRTRLGDRLVAGLALSRRFGAADDHHPADAEGEAHGHSSWDAFAELTTEWEDRQAIAGEPDEHSGGHGVFLSPGVRFNAASNWSAAAQVGVPIRQRIGKSHPDTAFRLAFALARTF